MHACDILGVTDDATLADIKRAYHRLARVYHPDHGGRVEDFARVRRAYETLIAEPKPTTGPRLYQMPQRGFERFEAHSTETLFSVRHQSQAAVAPRPAAWTAGRQTPGFAPRPRRVEVPFAMHSDDSPPTFASRPVAAPR